MYPIIQTQYYQCPEDAHVLNFFHKDVKTLSEKLPTLLMVDLNKKLTKHYQRTHFGHENASNPDFSHQRLHFILCHDIKTYQETSRLQFIDPRHVSEIVNIIQTTFKSGTLIANHYNAPFVQICDIQIGHQKSNITLFFGGLRSFYYILGHDSPLIHLKHNQLHFMNAEKLHEQFLNIPYDAVAPATLPEPKQPIIEKSNKVTQREEITPSEPTFLEAWKKKSIATDESKEDVIETKLTEFTKNKKTISFLNDNVYAALQEDIVSEAHFDTSNLEKLFRSQPKKPAATSSNAVTRRRTQDTPSPTAVKTTSAWSGAYQVFQLSTQILSKAAQVRFFPRPQYNVKAYIQDTNNKHAAHAQHTSPITEKDPLEKLLKQFTPAFKPESYNISVHSDKHSFELYELREFIIKSGYDKYHDKATEMKVNLKQQGGLQLSIMLLALAQAVSFYKGYTAKDTDYGRDCFYFSIAMLVLTAFIYSIKLVREPARIDIRDDVLIYGISETIKMSKEQHLQNSLWLKYSAFAASILFYKEALLHQVNVSFDDMESPLIDNLIKTTALLPQSPAFDHMEVAFGLETSNIISRTHATMRTLNTFSIIYGKKIYDMITSCSIPEIQVPSMSTEAQIALMKEEIEKLNYIKNELAIPNRRLSATQCNELFDCLDRIILIYMLRNDSQHDPFFASFKKDHEKMIEYGEKKINDYIAEQNYAAGVIHDNFTIHQTPVKSKLFTCAWQENREAVIHSIYKLIQMEPLKSKEKASVKLK